MKETFITAGSYLSNGTKTLKSRITTATYCLAGAVIDGPANRVVSLKRGGTTLITVSCGAEPILWQPGRWYDGGSIGAPITFATETSGSAVRVSVWGYVFRGGSKADNRVYDS